MNMGKAQRFFRSAALVLVVIAALPVSLQHSRLTQAFTCQLFSRRLVAAPAHTHCIHFVAFVFAVLRAVARL
ncbi:MAG: hypothetical protein LBS10_00820, partial [Gracilibacteraceae bacterium]|nr:hypothetical protein [Gracilibacteraceae bacterium]